MATATAIAVRHRSSVVTLVTDIATDMSGRYDGISLNALVAEKSIDFWRAEHSYKTKRGFEGRFAGAAEELGITTLHLQLLLHLDLVAEMHDVIENLILSGSTIVYTPMVKEIMDGVRR